MGGINNFNTMKMVVIIDYGMGNLGSIQNRLKRIGAQATISSKTADIEKAEKLILPGVGHFDAGMENLEKRRLLSVLEKRVIAERTPILGICLGMQLLTKKSEEGDCAGLGWIDAETKKFDFQGENDSLKIPHMGWNSLEKKRGCPLLDGLPASVTYYFVHSYYVDCNDSTDIVATTSYGYDFAAIIQKDNIFGTQFHPEKSHQYGITLLKNFLEIA